MKLVQKHSKLLGLGALTLAGVLALMPAKKASGLTIDQRIMDRMVVDSLGDTTYISPDSGFARVYWDPTGIWHPDSSWRPADSADYMIGYWFSHRWIGTLPGSWNTQIGDSFYIMLKDAFDVFSYEKVVTDNAITIPPRSVCGGFGASVLRVDGKSKEKVDLNAVCIKASTQQKLQGGGFVSTQVYPVYFDIHCLDPQPGDSFRFEIRTKGYSGQTGGRITGRYLSYESFPSCSLNDTINLGIADLWLPDTITTADTVVPSASIYNQGVLSEKLKAKLQIGSYKDSLEKIVGPGSDSLIFKPFNTQVPGSHLAQLRIYSEFDGSEVDDTTSKEIYVKQAGIEEKNKSKGIRIYPIPANGKLYVEGLPKEAKVSVYNICGGFVNNIEGKIDNLRAWDFKDSYGRKVPHGIYFLHITADDKKKVEKAILLK